MYWIRHLTRAQIDPRTWTDCKLFYFLFYFGRQYSSMLLFLMSLEKCFAVYFPLKSKTICTVKVAKWTTGIVGVILAGYDSVYFLLYASQIDKTSGYMKCVVVKDHWKMYLFYYTFDSILYSFGPFALMFITNFAIVFKFLRAKCFQSNSTESTNQALVKSATRGTAMVVTVSVTFILLTAPAGIEYALKSMIDLGSIPEYRVFVNITMYLNHSINGILYCIVGSRFRNELLKVFCRKKRSSNSSIACTNSSTSFQLSGK